MAGTELIQRSGTGVSIALEPVAGGVPLWRHFGARLGAGAEPDASAWPLAGARPLPPNALDGDPALSLLPTHGLGWFGQPALAGSRIDGSDWAQQFELVACEQSEHSLHLTLRDEVAGLNAR